MANLEALLKSEAQTEIDAIISEAKSRASEIVAQADEEAGSLKAQRERQANSQHEATIVRGKSAAQLEASSLKLRTQHELVERAFEEAQKQLTAIIKDSARYGDIMGKLLDEVVETLGGQDAVESVTVNTKDKALISDILGARGINASVKTDRSLSGGLRAKAKGTNIVVSNSLLARLEAARDELASDVSQALFAS
ncbi:MAG: V-type ATP synthase subunit E [Deinococcota bacterium]